MFEVARQPNNTILRLLPLFALALGHAALTVGMTVIVFGSEMARCEAGEPAALRRSWLRRKRRAAVLIAAGIGLGLLSSPVHAQQCEPAGAVVEVRAIVAGSDTLTVSYTIVNNTRSSLVWISIGSGGPERTQVVPQQTPVVTSAPPGWLGTVVYPEETSYMHLWWEAKDVAAALPPGAATSGLVARVAGPSTVLPGLRGMDGRLVRPIDFGKPAIHRGQHRGPVLVGMGQVSAWDGGDPSSCALQWAR